MCEGFAKSIVSFIIFIEKFFMAVNTVFLFGCVILTVIVALCLGIGIGYNYCFVDFKASKKHVTAYYKYVTRTRTYYRQNYHWEKEYYRRRANQHDADAFNSNNEDIEEPLQQPTPDNLQPHYDLVKKSVTEDGVSILSRINTTREENEIKNDTHANDVLTSTPKSVIPISGLDLISFLSKLRSQDKNYTLQIVI